MRAGAPAPSARRGGHELIFPARVDTAVAATYVGLRVRLGVESASGLPSGGGTFDVNTLTVGEGLDVGLALTDWLGVFVTGAGRALLGSNVPGLIFQGATYDLGGAGGAIVRLFESERTGTQVSLRGQGAYLAGQIASLLPIFQIGSAGVAVREALRGNLRSSIYSPITTVRYGGSVALAQGFGPLFAVQASAGLGGAVWSFEPFDLNAGRRDEIRVTGVTYQFGVAPSVDLRTVGVPLAVMPEVLLVRGPGLAQLQGNQSFDTVLDLLAGLYYSGRPNLQLGLIGGTVVGAKPVRSDVGSSSAPRQLSGELVVRHVW